MQAFVQLREALSTHKELASQFRELERTGNLRIVLLV